MRADLKSRTTTGLASFASPPSIAAMTGGIFLLREDDELVEMLERPYDSEAALQQLLAKHQSLLAGDQLEANSSRRWLHETSSPKSNPRTAPHLED
jgi:hypothetical protein